GYAVQQPYYVDLTVLDIYTSTSSSPTFTSSVNPFSSDVAPSQSINNLYAKIKNQGTLISRPFSIIACWYNPQNPSMRAYFGQSQPIPKNCFKIVRVSYGLAPGETRVINLGNWDVQGKIVQVKVDYYNEIPENNENNNEMIKNFGGGDVSPITCIDPDGLNYSVKSTCMDSLGGHTDYCSSDTENVLVEYYCPISGQPMCTPTQYVCSSPNICIDGKCSELGVLKSDLIITNIERKSYGTIEGTKITMMNNGTAPVSGPRSFFTKVTYYLGTEKWEQEYQIQNLGYVPGATFILEVKDKDIKGKAVDISAFVDSKDDVDELNENNNGLSVWLSPYSCEGWNNIYEIALEDFGLRAPKYENVYVLKTEMVYGSTVLSSEEALFTVEEKEPTHKACQNNKCVRISGAGSDQCETNSDCAGGGSCNENWLYGQWSNCVGGKRRRLCYDANHCNTTYSKPSNCLYYVDGYYQTESCCVPNWQCDEWSVCYKLQGELVQSMTCRDINECEPENSSYTQYRDCCIENWDCKWTACMNGMQQKICEDINYCGTEFTKPVTEIRECEKQGIAWWVWLIIILVLIIVVLAILIGTGRLPWFKKKPKTEEAKKYPQLQDYIKKASERGMTKEQVRTKLIESGWPEDIVNKNLK
ncbi:MAG TPA: hypothetical protein EYP80_02580, partial [Candidatus Aenigmarchaeota archaeon]|nr:hypothetical protein [Candidatus Aenigmarchaeota archaeon]